MAQPPDDHSPAAAEHDSTAEASPIVAITRAYEDWLRTRIDIVEEDLAKKHAEMASSAFAFLRATFYRWASLWPETCPKLAEAPRVLAVGDLHVENFGTWRDSEGRLVWGVNDFDEVARMPYTLDLVRLATSAILAKRADGLTLHDDAAAAAVLAGYTAAMQSGGKPFVVEENHPALREMALSAERSPAKVWAKATGPAPIEPPKRVRRLLEDALPSHSADVAFRPRVAGVGALGHPRYVATANCGGGLVAREAKAWVPSAWGWAHGKIKEQHSARRLVKHAVREPDPFYAIEKAWVVRRIGPHCGRIELGELPEKRDEEQLLKAMGHEAANLHLATPGQCDKIIQDLANRGKDWLIEAADAMATATERDWKAFRSASTAR